jgi:hypothetical protein
VTDLYLSREEIYRRALAAVLEALDVPHPAAMRDESAWTALLTRRLRCVRFALTGILADPADLEDFAWLVAGLRTSTAGHPATPAGHIDRDQGGHEDGPQADTRTG